MKIIKPIVFDPKQETLEQFKQKYHVDILIDDYDKQLEELFLIRNPRMRFVHDYKQELNNFIELETSSQDLKFCGTWFYFESSRTLMHYFHEEQHFELRTARNKNLITKDEQIKFYQGVVGIAGLSIGSHAALTIVMMGGCKRIKLADPDDLSISNINRVRYPATKFGQPKVMIAAQYILEINPYAEVELFTDGLNIQNMSDFFSDLDILIEAMDNLGMKIKSRQKAKELEIPVIMATDNGDGIIVDIERYDQNKNLALFNGALEGFNLDEFENFPPSELPKLATKIAGPDYIVSRMLSSLAEVGKTLYSWPQLGSAATFSGLVLAYLVRKIIVGDQIDSGKYDMSIDSILDASYNKPENIKVRKEMTSNFLKALGL